jgi:hypothetical protein
MAPMRSMARPLAPSPLARPVIGRQAATMHRSSSLHVAQGRDVHSTGPTPRRSHGEPGNTRMVELHHRQAHVHRNVSARHEIRRRRTNVLFILLMATCGTLFLAATTHADTMLYAFALSFLALCGYCYKLVQLRQLDQQSSYTDNSWFRAA